MDLARSGKYFLGQKITLRHKLLRVIGYMLIFDYTQT